MYNQGDIVVVKFPFTDGSEFKKRPAMVISNRIVNQKGEYLIVQITSKLNNDGFSILINDDDCLKPLPLKSYIRPHKIFTVHQDIILSKISSVKPVLNQKVSDIIYRFIKVET